MREIAQKSNDIEINKTHLFLKRHNSISCNLSNKGLERKLKTRAYMKWQRCDFLLLYGAAYKQIHRLTFEYIMESQCKHQSAIVYKLTNKCIHELHQIFLLLKESNKLLLNNYNFEFIVRALKMIPCLH